LWYRDYVTGFRNKKIELGRTEGFGIKSLGFRVEGSRLKVPGDGSTAPSHVF
jgi:hypothetical protein